MRASWAAALARRGALHGERMERLTRVVRTSERKGAHARRMNGALASWASGGLLG